MRDHYDVAPAIGAEMQISLLMAMLEDSTDNWREELGQVSAGAVLWQPSPQSHSVGALILHIADVEAYWLHEIGAGQARAPEELAALLSEETQQYQGLWPTPPARPLSWFLARHDEIRARTRAVVRRWDDPALVRAARGKEFSRRWLLYHVLTHEAYHGGQAVLLSILHAQQ